MKKVSSIVSLCFAMFLLVGTANLNAGCKSGGVNSTSCTFSYQVGIFGWGGTRTQSVSCQDGQYACCTETSATCHTQFADDMERLGVPYPDKL